MRSKEREKRKMAFRLTLVVASLGYLCGCAGRLEVRETGTPAALSTVLPAVPAAPASTTPAEAAPVEAEPILEAQNEGEVTPTVTSPPVSVELCSPIDGMTWQDLEGAVVTPFLPPPPGSDDPHHGVDLADKDPGTGLALEGRGVEALMPGRVAAVAIDRFPFGNSVIIETALKDLPREWLEKLDLPEIAPVDLSASALTCPILEPIEVSSRWEDLSFYVLYAHLKDEPTLRTGDNVECGQAIGQIGNSGNSINPHLHLEVRLGMAGFPLGSMAHYDASVTPDEMRIYCLWRISGYFARMNPMQLLELIPNG